MIVRRIAYWVAMSWALLVSGTHVLAQDHPFDANDFKPAELLIVGPQHERSLSSVSAKPPIPAMKAAIPELQKLFEAQRAQSGEASAQAFILAADIAYLTYRVYDKSATTTWSERARAIHAALSTQNLDQRIRRGVEDRFAQSEFARASVLDWKDWRRRTEILTGAIRRHQSIFGDVPRQWALYAFSAEVVGRAGNSEGFDIATGEHVMRPYVAFADRMKDVDQQILSRALLLDLYLRSPKTKAQAVEVARQMEPLVKSVDKPDKPVHRRYAPFYDNRVLRALEGMKKILFEAGISKIDPRQQAFEEALNNEFLLNTSSDAIAWIFEDALKIREKNESRFWAAMEKIGLKAKECTATSPAKLCGVRVADGLAKVGWSDLAWEYARIARAYVDKTPGVSARDVATSYTTLASYERKAGFVGKANELERLTREKLAKEAHVERSTTDHRKALTEDPSRELDEIKANSGVIVALRIAAERSFGATAVQPTQSWPNKASASLHFIVEHLDTVFSAPDLVQVARAAETELPDRIKLLVNDTDRLLAGALIEEIEWLPPALRDALAELVRARAANDRELVSDRGAGLLKVYPDRSKVSREQAYLFCKMWFGGACEADGVSAHRFLSRLLWADDPAARAREFSNIIKLKANEEWGLNNTNNIDGFLADLESGRSFAARIGDAWLARAFANEYIKQSTGLVTSNLVESSQQRIHALLSTHIWLVRDAIIRGQRGEALRMLAEAERHAVRRLSREWRSGGAKAAETLAKLRPQLRALAEVRAQLFQTAAPQDELRAAELAFAAAQYPQVADISLELLANAQRRRAGNPELEKALAAREELEAEQARVDSLRKAKISYQAPAEAAAAKARIASKMKAADERIRAAMPDAAHSTTLEPLAMADVMRLLKSGESIVSSVVADERTSFILLTDRNAFLWQVPVGRRALESRIAELRRGVEADERNQIASFPLEAAHRLFVDLFGPVRNQLLAAEHVMLVADGPLLGLPMHMLLTEPAKVIPKSNHEFRSARLSWLVHGPAISVVPSLRSVEALRKAPASMAPQAFAGIGDPALVGAKGQLRKATVSRVLTREGQIDVNEVKRLEPLPETADELRHVAQSVGGRAEDLFLREKATERLLKRAGLQRYRIISFATHGLMAGDLTGLVEPALVLTPPTQASADDDGLLTASEIAALKLDADLVILSACNTAAANGTPQAEGLSGLARAFFAAGARSVIASHWPVPSASTAQLMARTATHKASGPQMNWSKALRAAMIDLIDKEGPPDFAHPMHWAPFISVGAN